MSERRISEKSLENLRKSNQESNLLTREAIETALLQLLEKKDLTKISISELVNVQAFRVRLFIAIMILKRRF